MIIDEWLVVDHWNEDNIIVLYHLYIIFEYVTTFRNLDMHLTFNEPINACNDGNDGLHGIGCSSAGLRLLCLMIRCCGRKNGKLILVVCILHKKHEFIKNFSFNFILPSTTARLYNLITIHNSRNPADEQSIPYKSSLPLLHALEIVNNVK